MKKHTKIYMEYFDYGLEDFIPCEVCGSKAVDIHHIEARGMGGSKSADTIENLMAVCRSCHLKSSISAFLRQRFQVSLSGPLKGFLL